MPKRPDPNFSDTQFARVPAFLRVRGDQIVGLEDHKGNLLGMPVTSTTSSGSEVDLSGVKAPGGTLTADQMRQLAKISDLHAGGSEDPGEEDVRQAPAQIGRAHV
mgnify:CR=1 FL=1